MIQSVCKKCIDMNSLVTLVKPGQNIVTREESWSNENDQGLWSCLVKVK